MNPQCPKCRGEMRYVAPGVSKAGKPYPGFYSCKVFTCDGTFNPPKNAPQQQNNQGGYVAPNQPPIAPPQAPSASTERVVDLLTKINQTLEAIEKKIPLTANIDGKEVPVPPCFDGEINVDEIM